MKSRLTLRMKKAVIAHAKMYAKNKGKSLSGIVEDFLSEITVEQEYQNLSPKLKRIVGAVKLPAEFNEANEIHSYYKSRQL